MELISKADVVLALGTRLNPFSTLPGYGIDYWPKDAAIIQVDINPDRIGLTKPVTVGIIGDARKVAEGILARLADNAGDAGRAERKALISKTKSAWAQQLSSMDHEDDDPGTTWNERARKAKPDWMSPRMAWRAIQAALPKDAIISSDIATTAPSATPIRPSRRVANTSPPVYSVPAATACPRSWVPRSASRYAGGRFRRRRSVRYLDERDDGDRPQGMAGDHHGDLPQLPVGCGKAQHHALVSRQLRWDRT